MEQNIENKGRFNGQVIKKEVVYGDLHCYDNLELLQDRQIDKFFNKAGKARQGKVRQARRVLSRHFFY